MPGDYAGGTKDNLKLKSSQTIEVAITEGLYVTIPDGYEAPLYFSEQKILTTKALLAYFKMK